jgi:hypothetical protein
MFGKKKRADVGTYVDPPITPLAPIERVVDEGALIYVASARMALMNYFIVGALGEHIDYEPDALRDVVRAELERLAIDNEDTAARLEDTDTVEYDSDMPKDLTQQKRNDQRRRPEVHRLIAENLRACADSDEQVDRILTQARADAVDAMFRAIQSRLTTTSVEPEEDYESLRAQRISDFVQFDLLGAQTPKATEAEAAADDKSARKAARKSRRK